jgi:HSP20 family molecular chaperone IbpA
MSVAKPWEAYDDSGLMPNEERPQGTTTDAQLYNDEAGTSPASGQLLVDPASFVNPANAALYGKPAHVVQRELARRQQMQGHPMMQQQMFPPQMQPGMPPMGQFPQYQQFPGQQPPGMGPIPGLVGGGYDNMGVPMQAHSGQPYMETICNQDSYDLYIDLPGIDRSSISAKIKGSSIIISGSRVLKSAAFAPKPQKPVKEEEVAIDPKEEGADGEAEAPKKKTRKKRKVAQENTKRCVSTVPHYLAGQFEFCFGFDKRLDPFSDEITKSYEDGVLHYHLPFMQDMPMSNTVLVGL